MVVFVPLPGAFDAVDNKRADYQSEYQKKQDQKQVETKSAKTKPSKTKFFKTYVRQAQIPSFHNCRF